MAINFLGMPMVANIAFVQLAVEAGIVATLRSLVGMATSLPELVTLLHDQLIGSNPPLAEAMNYDTVNALLAYMALAGESVVLVRDLPVALNENGPATVSGGRDGGEPTQINIGFSTPPVGYKALIFLDGVFLRVSTQTGDPTVFDAIASVPLGYHNVRVLYRRDDDGALTRFGPLVEILT